MTKDKPVISVIISSFNGKHFLERCLESLFSEKGCSYEVVLVDNGSTDGSLEFVREKFGNEDQLKLVAIKENVGVAKARNIGAANASGRYFFFLDNDTKTKAGWSDEIVRFFEGNKKAGLAQAKLLKMGSNRFDSAGDWLSPLGFLVERARSAEDRGQFDRVAPILSLKTAAAIVKREVFEKIGGFDKDYYIFWEDTDFAWRTWLAGYQVLFAPRITVWHAYGTQEKDERYYQRYQKFYRITYLGCRNTITTLIKNLGRKRILTMLPTNIGCWLALSLLFLVRLRFDKTLAIFKGLLWNLIHLPQTLRKRDKIQSGRRISDDELFLKVGTKRELSYYLGKALAYVTGRPF